MKFSIRQKIQGIIRQKKVQILSSGVRFGKNVYIGRNSSIGCLQKLVFGDDIYIGKNVTIETWGLTASFIFPIF